MSERTGPKPPTDRGYKSDPLNALNLEYETFRSEVLELAFSSPQTFFAVRRELTKTLLEKTVTNMYALVFNALTLGTDASDTELVDSGKVGGFKLAPNMSHQKADEVALDLVAGLKDLLKRHVVDELLPPGVFRNSLQRAGKAAALSMGTGEGGAFEEKADA